MKAVCLKRNLHVETTGSNDWIMTEKTERIMRRNVPKKTTPTSQRRKDVGGIVFNCR
jgi:hypothetical protein